MVKLKFNLQKFIKAVLGFTIVVSYSALGLAFIILVPAEFVSIILRASLETLARSIRDMVLLLAVALFFILLFVPLWILGLKWVEEFLLDYGVKSSLSEKMVGKIKDIGVRIKRRDTPKIV